MTLKRRRRINGQFTFEREDGLFISVRASSWEEAEPLAKAKLEKLDKEGT